MTMQPNAFAPSAVRPRSSAGFTAAGIVQIVLSGVLGLGELLIGVGVAMCTAGGSSVYCNRVSVSWSACGLLLLANVAAGAVLLRMRRVESVDVRRTAAICSAVLALALVGSAAYLASLVSQPIH